MDGVENRVAAEALKPAAGFIAAALGPKIEKVKAWAQERELKGKLDPQVLSEIMRDYLVKLSVRTSEITSITFPQLKLNIHEAYEPLSVREIKQYSGQAKIVPIDDVLSPSKRAVMIVDGAGMGKSTFSKYIVAKLLFKSDRIPIFFELRKVNPDIGVVENFASELDFPGNKFNRDLFYKLLELGKFYVVLDGFDEVKVDHQAQLAREIQALSEKCSDNTLLLTSRPQDVMPELVNSISLEFSPFTIDQAKSLIDRYDRISGLDVGARLKEEIGSVPKKLLESPLLVSLLYRTFGVNKSIADRASTFYDEIYSALYKGHDLVNKSGYAREKKSNLDFESFRKLLRALCYYMMLNRKVSLESWNEAISYISKAASISSVNPASSSEFLDDLLLTVPLMQRDGVEYRFFHKTILEYFAAEYIVFDGKSGELLEKIFLSKLAPSFDKVFDFVADIDSVLFGSVVTRKFAEEAQSVLNRFEGVPCEIVSAFLCMDIKLGLWSEKENGQRMPGHKELVLGGEALKHEFNAVTWAHGTLNGEKYFCGMSYVKKYENFHFRAWEKISSPVESYKPKQRGKYNFDDLYAALGENVWVAVDEKLLLSGVLNNDAVKELSRRMLSGLFRAGKLSTLCSSKIDGYFRSEKARIALEVEMSEFL
jgi:hypothetical protein